MKREKKSLGHTVWFKVVLTLLIFLPNFSQIPYEQADTTSVIAFVMAHPLIVSTAWLLPVFKLLLLWAAVSPFVFKNQSAKVVLGYYAFILVATGLFQNMAQTEAYGFVWLPGNTLIEFIVGAFCAYDLIKGNSVFHRKEFNRSRLWLIPLMLPAFLMPYGISAAGTVMPAFRLGVLGNEAGVTYCMITPVIIGIMLLFSRGVHKPTLSVASFAGFIFGLLNMITWFGIQRASWWMGVLHLPLVIIALYGLRIAYKEKK